MRVLLRDSMDSKLFATEVSAAYAVDYVKYTKDIDSCEYVDFDFVLRMESGFGDLYIVFDNQEDLNKAIIAITSSVFADFTDFCDGTFLDPDESDLSRILAKQLDLKTDC